jgi:hypothetical protein
MANSRCSNMPDFVVSDCVFESGRVVALAFVHKDVQTPIYANPSNPALWVDGAYSSDIIIFKNVRGSFDGGSPIEVPGTGNQSTKVINADRTLTVMVQGVKGNEDVWNELVKEKGYRVAWVVGSDYGTLFFNNVDTSIFATAPVEEGLDTEVMWNVTVKWKDVNLPKSSNVPTGIFE